MSFGQKLKKLRREKGMSQQELVKKLGYVTNSYVSEIEKGNFIPSKEKLKKIAKALRVPFRELDNLLLESKIRELGIKKPELIALFQDILKLPEKEKRQTVEVYLKIKEKLKKKP